MSKRQRAGTLPVHRVALAKAQRTALRPVHRAATPRMATRDMVPASLVDKQGDDPAPNDTGPPTTPTEAGITAPEPAAELTTTELEEARQEEKEPGEEEKHGAVMNWFDELGS